MLERNLAPSVKMKEHFRHLINSYLSKHQDETALFWASQLISLSDEDGAESTEEADHILFAEVLLRNGHYRRAAHRLQNNQLDTTTLKGCYLTAKALVAAEEHERALECLDKAVDIIRQAQEDLSSAKEEEDKQSLRMSLSSIYLLKGKVLENLDNRKLASEALKEALRIDVHCSEAFLILIKHQMLTSQEEAELLSTLPFDQAGGNSEMLSALYKVRVKKYASPEDHQLLPTLINFRNTSDMAVIRAELYFYDCEYSNCLMETSSVIKDDPFHPECLPIHIACLVELNHFNDLFKLAHKLVDYFPEWSIAWFSVGTYYYCIGKQDFARRYLSKSTQLDKVFGPAWLAYGHSFGLENEHDQAMAAYFKASQLMKGCHLPLLYIGVEYGLTNNASYAERFFTQALEIAPSDPFVLHELGVTSYQRNDFRGAERYFLKALVQVQKIHGSVLSVKWEPLLNNLGHAARKLGKYDEALEYHKQALVLVPRSASTYSCIGHVHALKFEVLEAMEAFHKALGIRRDDIFSTTMLNYLLEIMASEGFGDEMPVLELPSSKASPSILATTQGADIEMSDNDITMEM